MRVPKVAGIAMVKNEQDVIEAFVRHNIGLFDHLIVLDNGSVDDTRLILAKLAAEFRNLVVADDEQFGYTQSEQMTRLLHESQAVFAADFVVPLDADEFLDSADLNAFYGALEQIPAGGFGLIPWCTFVLSPDSVDSAACDPPRSMVWRRRVESPAYYKAILRLDGSSPADLEIEQGNHAVRSTSGRTLPAVRLSGLRLLHYPVRSRDQLIAKSVVGWMAYLAKDADAVERGQGIHWYSNFKRIADGQSIDLKQLCEMSFLYAQHPRIIDWNSDLVQETPQLNYERRYSEGRYAGSLELIVRSWERSLMASQNVNQQTKATPEDNSEALGKAMRPAGEAAAQLIGEGRPQDAVKVLEEAIVLGESADLWNDWATAQHCCGNAEECERGYHRALKLNGSHRQSAVNLGIFLISRGRLEEGVPLLEKHRNALTEEEKLAILRLATQLQPVDPAVVGAP
jgi:glycosyltransferase involved in cell wall biosynthesis